MEKKVAESVYCSTLGITTKIVNQATSKAELLKMKNALLAHINGNEAGILVRKSSGLPTVKEETYSFYQKALLAQIEERLASMNGSVKERFFEAAQRELTVEQFNKILKAAGADRYYNIYQVQQAFKERETQLQKTFAFKRSEKNLIKLLKAYCEKENDSLIVSIDTIVETIRTTQVKFVICKLINNQCLTLFLGGDYVKINKDKLNEYISKTTAEISSRTV